MTRLRAPGRRTLVLLPLFGLLFGVLTALAQELTVTTSSDQARDLYLKAQAADEQQRSVDAQALYKQAIQADPQFALAYLGKATTDPTRAERRADLMKAAELAKHASEGEQMLITATQAFYDGNGETLRTTMDQLVSRFPGDKHLLLSAAGSAMMLNENQKTLELTTRATKIDPKFGPAYNLMGYAQIGLGNFEAAEAALKTYTQLTPDEPNPYDSYAELLLNMGRYDESIEQYANALKRDPKFQSAILGTGNNYVFKGDLTKARENFQHLIDNGVTPMQKASGYEFLAGSYLYEGKTDEAVKALEGRQKLAAESGGPGQATSYQMAGFVLTEAGRPEEGVKYFEKAKDALEHSKLSEADRSTIMATAGPLEAYALAAAKKPQEAHALLEKVKPLIEKRGQPVEMMNLHTAMGLVAGAEGNLDEAIAEFGQGDPNNAVNTYHEALALEKKGEASKAMTLYTKVTKSNRNDLGLAAVRKSAQEHMESVQAGTQQAR